MPENSALPVLTIIVASVLVIVPIYLGMTRVRRLREWAERKGYRYSATGRKAEKVYPFKVFKLGRSRIASNIMTGKHKGLKFQIFDYSSERGSGARAMRFSFTAAVIKYNRHLPFLEIGRNGYLMSIDPNLFINCVDIEFSPPSFNRFFKVNATEDGWAQEIVHEKVAELFLENYMIQYVALEKNHILFCCHGDDTEIERTLDFAYEFISLLPDFVKKNKRISIKRRRNRIGQYNPFEDAPSSER